MHAPLPDQPQVRDTQTEALSAVEELLYHAPVGLMTITLEGIVVAHNNMLCRWLGLPEPIGPGAIVGVNAFDWLTPESRAEMVHAAQVEVPEAGQLRELMIFGRKYTGELSPSILNVDLAHSATGEPLLHIAMIDATERVRFEQELLEARAAAGDAMARLSAAQEQLRHDALHDQLTGLPNKSLLEEQLRRMMGSATRSGQPCAVVFLDLDHFREFNSSAGYPEGDRAIQEVAARIRKVCVNGEIVSRFAGDEFVIAVGPADELQLRELTERLHVALRRPLPDEDSEFSLTTSIGVVCWRPVPAEGAPHARQLFAAADRAIYEAKRDGRNRTVFAEWHSDGVEPPCGAP